MGRELTFVVASFFIGCTAFFVFILGTTAWREFHPLPELKAADMTAPGPANTPEEAEKVANAKEELLRVKLDAYSKRAEDLEKLASFLTGLSVLYALALGVTSYIGLQNNLQQAKAIGDELNSLREKAIKQLDEANTKATEVVREIRDEFPLFGFVDANLRRITKDFLRIMPFRGWSEEIYASLKPQTTEEILYYEKTAASLEFFDLGTIRTEVSRIYQGLGVFYALKYQHQREVLQQESPDDLARSRFYLDRATTVNPENFGAWNDRAWVALVLDQPPNLAPAKQYSRASMRINDQQQRAYYNLAVVEHLSGNYETAEDWLTRALTLENWEEEKYTGRVHNLYYNRACARGRLSRDPKTDSKQRTVKSLLQESLEDLKDAFEPEQLKYWDAKDWNAVAGDCLKEGDLGTVAREYAQMVKKLLSQEFPKVSEVEQKEGLQRLEEDLRGA